MVIIIWLVVSTPLKNMSSSVGIMTFPTEGKSIFIHVPNFPVTTNQSLSTGLLNTFA